jgi:hypothetical protein
MNGSSILQDWAKVRDKKTRRKKKTNRIEQPYRHLLCIAYGSAMAFLPPFSSISILSKKKMESIRSRSLNDPFTTLPFVL